MTVYAKRNVGGGLYVSSVSVNHNYGFGYQFAGGSGADVTITLRGYMHDGMRKIVDGMYNSNGAVYVSTDKPREEWHCLYCAVPNDVGRGKCEQCGAPRNWCF